MISQRFVSRARPPQAQSNTVFEAEIAGQHRELEDRVAAESGLPKLLDVALPGGPKALESTGYKFDQDIEAEIKSTQISALRGSSAGLVY